MEMLKKLFQEIQSLNGLQIIGNYWKKGERDRMLKIKLLNKSDQQWLEGRKDVEAQLEIYSSILNANDRVRAMKQSQAQPCESLVHYEKEQSLGMWLEESPFFTEMKKARTGNASW